MSSHDIDVSGIKKTDKGNEGFTCIDSLTKQTDKGCEAFDTLAYVENENLFGIKLQKSTLKPDATKKKLKNLVKTFNNLKKEGVFHIELDNSRTSAYPGCYLNCIVQAFYHVFDNTRWTMLLQMCSDIADKKSSLSKDLKKLSIPEECVDDDYDVQQENDKHNEMNRLKYKNLMVKYEVVVNFMDIFFRGLQCETNRCNENVLITRPYTLKLAKKIMANTPLTLGTDVSQQFDCMEIMNNFIDILHELHEPLASFIIPNLQKVLTCSKCKKKVRSSPIEVYGSVQFFVNEDLLKLWQNMVLPDAATRKNDFYYEMTKKHQGTFLPVKIQTILDNIHPVNVTNDSMTYTLPENDTVENDMVETNEDKLKRWNAITGLKCPNINCTSGSYNTYLELASVNDMIAVSCQAMELNINLQEGELTETGEVIEIENTGSGFRQLVPKFWPTDVDSIGELKCGRKKVKMRLDVIIFRTSNLNSQSGHFIISFRNKGRACKDTKDKWTTIDDDQITTGLPDCIDYYPNLYIFVKTS